jgi:hypothetical protein
MTAQDRLSIRGQLLAEIEQTENEFGHQRERAFRLVDELRDAATRIEQSAGLAPSTEDFTAETNPVHQLPPQFQSTLDFPKAVEVMGEMRKVRQRLCNLRQRNSLMSGRNSVNTL